MKSRPYAQLLYLLVICALVFGQPVAAGSLKSYRQAPAGTSSVTPSTFDSPLPPPTPEPTAVGSPPPSATPVPTDVPRGTVTPPATTPPPSATPIPTRASVGLSFLAEPAFVTPGQIITYTVALANDSSATVPGIELSNTLPAALDFVRGSDWTYDRPTRRLSRLVPPLQAGVAITFTFQARLNDLPLGSVVTNTVAAVAPIMRQPLTAESAVDVAGPAADAAWFDTPGGWLRSRDGQVALKLAPGSVTGATHIGYKARPDLMGLEGGLRYAFSLDAHDAAGQPQHRFAAPLELVLSYQPGEFPADPALALRLVYYNEATQTWEHLPTKVDARRRQLRTQINHLSLFGALVTSTEPPTFTTERMSQVRGAQGNLFNLSIAYDYDFRLPAGSGGLTPRLGLHYDSTNHYSQQSHLSLVGGGWGVTGADFVYSTPGGVETTLFLQGHTYTLVNYQGGWFAREDPLLRIQHTAVDDPYFGSANYSDWRVTTRDGAVYHFRAEATHNFNSFNLPYPGEFYWGCTPQGIPDVWRNLKWVRVPLVDVTDAHGNTISYTWLSEEKGSDGTPYGCAPMIPEMDKFVRALRLSQVTYGNGHLRVRLDYTGRNDIAWDHDKSNSWNFYPTVKLSTITVEAQLPSLAWTGVRTYTLGHSNIPTEYDEQTLLNLISVTEDGGGLSETTTFGKGDDSDFAYNPCTFDHLRWIQNAYGGKVSFTTAEPGYCNADSLRGQVLATRTETDLVTNQSATWTYHHGNDWDAKAHGYGSVWVDRPEGAEVHHFWTTAYVNGQPITHLAGKEKERWDCASQTNGACSNWLTFTATDWISTTQSLPLANYSAMPLQVQPRFVHASEVREHQQNTTVKRTVYRYDPAAQVSPNGNGAAQYGNLTEVQEYAGAANGWAAQPYRTSRTRYYPNHAEWIIDRPAVQQVYAGTATLVAETRSYYDHHANLGDAPDPGDLTRQEQVAVRGGQYEDASRWTHRDYSYDTYGNRTLVQDELQHPTTTCYDGWFHAFPLKTTNALQQSSSAYYYGVPGGSCAVADGPLSFGPGRFGLLERSQDANGVSTTYTYDDLGRVTSVVEPPNDGANPTRTFTYRASAGIGPNQPFWVQEAVRDDGGETNYRATYTFYDGFGRILQRSTEAPRAVGGQVQYIESRNAYNWRDAKRYASVPAYVLAESDGSTVYHPVTNWTTLPHTGYEYDAHGRLSKTIGPDLTAERTYYSVTATSETRLLTAAIDAKDHMTIHESDPFGRLVTAKQFAGEFTGEPGWGAPAYATAIYAYDVADRLESVTGPATPATRIYYDGLGRKERMEDVDLGLWRYSYTATGALETQTNAEACVTTFGYDDVGRLTGKSYSGPQKCATAAVSYTYDEGLNGIGRRTAMRDGSGSTTWQYDVRGRAIAETRTIADTAFTTYRTYRSDNSLATLAYPDGEEVTYGYDATGRVTSLNGTAYEGSGQPGNYLSGAAYTALGQPANLQYGNGAVVGYTYHPDDYRLAAITAPGVSLWYDYDPAGNVRTITDTLQTTPVTTFGYDELDRLKSARGAYSADYTYSANGNLLTKGEGGSSVSLTYPAPDHAHAPASVNGVSYSYDNNGNVTSDGRRTMTYDAENRLSQVISGTLTTTFAYDGDGNLVVRVAPDGTKTLYVSPAFEVTVSTAAPPPPPTPSPRPGYMVYLPWVSSRALSCSTLIEGHPIQIRKHYLLGQQRIAQRDACNGATTVFFYHDLLGSTAATSAGESARYWPYGNMRSGNLNSTDYRFTGQRNDSSIELYLMGARWYDPSLGRFISPDSIIPDPGNPQDLNRYAYALGNPVKYRDPTGHWVETAFDVVSVGFDIATVKQDPSFWNVAALIVDVGAVIVPFVPSGAGWLARGRKAATVLTHIDLGIDALRAARGIDQAADAVAAANKLREVASRGDDVSDFARILAEASTHGSGERVVLGQWVEGAGYIAEAQKNGGRYYETASGVWDALGRNEKLAWAANEQFLRLQLESGVKRIDFVGESIDDVLTKAIGSFRWKEVNWLLDNAGRYGYELVGNSWVKVAP